jgi:hypothetical protein
MFFSKQYHIVGQSWNVRCDEKCSSGKHINNSIPIEDLIRRRQGRQYYMLFSYQTGYIM